jgi:PAS domain S-box-containing protein
LNGVESNRIIIMNESVLLNRIRELELELSRSKSEIALARKGEQDLKDSYAKFLGLVNYIPAFIAYVNADTLKYEYANDLYEKSFGIPRGKIIGSHVKDILGEGKFNFALKYINEVRSGKSCNYENSFDIAPGKRWIQVNYSPVFDANSKVAGIAIVNFDITERKQAEESLRESEERFQLLFDKAPLGYQSLDSRGNFIDVNQQWLDTLGYNRSEVIGKWFGDFLAPGGQEVFRKHFSNFKALGKIRNEFEMIHKNGNKLFVAFEGKIASDPNGEFKQTHCILQDITNRKRIEDELLKSEALFKSVVQNLIDVTILTDEKGIVAFVSHQCDTVLGYKEKEFSGKVFPDIIHPDDKLKCLYEWENVLLQGKEVREFEYRIIDGQNKVRWVSHSARMVKSNGDSLGVQSTIRDISEHKKTEIDLINAKDKAEESERLKSAFLANMSHEIRTPMNGIVGFTQLLKEPGLTIDEQRDYINTIEKSGKRMLNTLNDIIDVSKIESGLITVEINKLDITQTLGDLYKFFKPEADAKGLHFSFITSLTAYETTIYTDIEKINSILTNLIKNAIKFTHSGSIEFGCEKKNEYFEFYVRDTGVGIPQKQKKIIFDRFRQGSESHIRNYEGAGLGLAISKSYVEMLHGKIWVDSEEGTGSVFYFIIPCKSESKESPGVKGDGSISNIPFRVKNLTVLIAEDDETSHYLLTLIFQKMGHTVIHARTGLQAIEACRSNPNLDLVMMDTKMPEIDGYGATRKIRKFNKDIIIIAQTAFGFIGEKEKAITAGCNDYVSKPIHKDTLSKLIQKFFNI